MLGSRDHDAFGGVGGVHRAALDHRRTSSRPRPLGHAMRRVILLSLVLVLAGSSPAAAGEVKVTAVVLIPDRSGDPSYAYVEFHGAPGERNAVTVTGGRAALVVRDTGEPLTAGAGCQALDAHAVECRSAYPPLTSMQLHGQDGDDGLTDTAPRISAQLFGGPGDDVLAGDDWQRQDGGEGADRLAGSATADSLQGGAGPDTVRAGKGIDTVIGDPAGAQGWPDRLDGGPGRDRVSYEGRTGAVNVDLQRSGPQGAPGERDVLSGFESASGGDGADILRGSDGPNFLGASGGGDVLVGRGGRDQLLGSEGDDWLVGGPGADWLDGVGGSDTYLGGAGDDKLSLFLAWYWGNDDARATPACGPGHDVAVDADEHTVVPRDCERIWFEGVTLRAVRARPGRLALGLSKVRSGTCRMTVRVTRAGDGRELARRVIGLRPRSPRRIDLRWQRRTGARVVVRLRARETCDSNRIETLAAFIAPVDRAPAGQDVP